MVRVLLTSALAAALLSVVQATKLYGVNYNIRSGPDWAPESTKCKSADVIDQELAKLKTITDNIRLYSLSDCNQAVKVIPAANKAGLKVSLGLWVGPDPATFAAEKLKLEELLSQDGLVTAANTPAIYVGSEAILRNDVNATTAIANINEVRVLCAAKQLKVPITLADTADVILKNPKLIDAVDFVSPNIFPFWVKETPAKGPAQLYGKIQQLMKIAKGKEIVISETGYPSDGTVEKGYPSATMTNAATYFQGFYDLAQKNSLKYFYFAGFDETWKLSSVSANSSIEAYFGIFDKDGEIKDAYKALKPVGATLVPTPSPKSDAGAPTTSTAAPATKTPVATPAPVPSSAPSAKPATTATPVTTSTPSKAPAATTVPATGASPSTAPAVAAAPAKEVVISGGKINAGGDNAYVPGAVSSKGVDASDPAQTAFVPVIASSNAGKTAPVTAASAAPATTPASTAPAAPTAPVTTAPAAPTAPVTTTPSATPAPTAPTKGSSEGPTTSGKNKRKDCDA